MTEEDSSSSSSESFNSDLSVNEDATSSTTPSSPPDEASSSHRVKQGYIELRDYNKKGKLIERWKLCWCLLDGSSLHVYKNYEKPTPFLSLDLRSLELSGDPHHNRQFSISFKTTDHHKWVAFCTAQELSSWRDALGAAKALEPTPVPATRPTVPPAQRTSSSLFKIKKSVAGRAATSKMGEALLMKMFGDEMTHLFHTIKKLITKHHSKQIANRVNKVLIRLTIKLAFLFEKKILTVSSLAEVDRPLREVLELISKYYNSRIRRYPRVFPVDETFARIEVLCRQAEDEMVKKLQPYISPKNLANVSFIFTTIATGEFLKKVFSDTEHPDELDELDDLITAYTQFHI